MNPINSRNNKKNLANNLVPICRRFPRAWGASGAGNKEFLGRVPPPPNGVAQDGHGHGGFILVQANGALRPAGGVLLVLPRAQRRARSRGYKRREGEKLVSSPTIVVVVVVVVVPSGFRFGSGSPANGALLPLL